MKDIFNWLIISILILLLIVLVLFVLNKTKVIAYNPFVYPFIGSSGCRCMRQPGGNRGFCGICGVSGTAYGCPQGQGACGENCKAIRYRGKACDPCRDPNC